MAEIEVGQGGGREGGGGPSFNSLPWKGAGSSKKRKFLSGPSTKNIKGGREGEGGRNSWYEKSLFMKGKKAPYALPEGLRSSMGGEGKRREEGFALIPAQDVPPCPPRGGTREFDNFPTTPEEEVLTGGREKGRQLALSLSRPRKKKNRASASIRKKKEHHGVVRIFATIVGRKRREDGESLCVNTGGKDVRCLCPGERERRKRKGPKGKGVVLSEPRRLPEGLVVAEER